MLSVYDVQSSNTGWRQLASVAYCHLFFTAPAAVDGELH